MIGFSGNEETHIRESISILFTCNRIIRCSSTINSSTLEKKQCLSTTQQQYPSTIQWNATPLRFLHHFTAHKLPFGAHARARTHTHARAHTRTHTHTQLQPRTQRLNQYFPSKTQNRTSEKIICTFLFSSSVVLYFDQQTYTAIITTKKKSQGVTIILRTSHFVSPRRPFHQSGNWLSAVTGKY